MKGTIFDGGYVSEKMGGCRDRRPPSVVFELSVITGNLPIPHQKPYRHSVGSGPVRMDHSRAGTG
jgi:hypothetical protein